MQISFLIFFYCLAFVLMIPVVVLGTFLKPPKKVQKPPTLEEFLEKISKKASTQALKIFEENFLDAEGNDKETWLKAIQKLAFSKHLNPKQINLLKEKLQDKNPNLKKEIASTMGLK